MARVPKVRLENLELSRLVCGTNPFLGISHFTPSRDLLLREYFTAERIAEVVGYVLEEFGVNAVISSPRDEIHSAIETVEREVGERLHWICTPSDQRVTAAGLEADLSQQIRWCAERGVSVCMPHRSFTDAHLHAATNEITGLEPHLAQIRDLGMVPGLSTHYHETLRVVARRKYDVALVVQPINPLGFMCNLEVNSLAKTIRASSVQVLAIKPFAAGRVLPEVGLPFVLNSIKPNDFVACGFDGLPNADYDCQLFLELLAGR
ncbi:MAG: hypothetical protein Kow0069_00450 [Promethearchaeota archaeon]